MNCMNETFFFHPYPMREYLLNFSDILFHSLPIFIFNSLLLSSKMNRNKIIIYCHIFSLNTEYKNGFIIIG